MTENYSSFCKSFLPCAMRIHSASIPATLSITNYRQSVSLYNQIIIDSISLELPLPRSIQAKYIHICMYMYASIVNIECTISTVYVISITAIQLIATLDTIMTIDHIHSVHTLRPYDHTIHLTNAIDIHIFRAMYLQEWCVSIFIHLMRLWGVQRTGCVTNLPQL